MSTAHRSLPPNQPMGAQRPPSIHPSMLQEQAPESRIHPFNRFTSAPQSNLLKSLAGPPIRQNITEHIQKASFSEHAPLSCNRTSRMNERTTTMKTQHPHSPSTRTPYCPTCQSPAAHLHPSLQHEGEVQLCRDQWHSPEHHSLQQS